MKSIIKLTRHPTDPDIIDVHAGPELAKIMGGLQAARWEANRRVYVITTDALPGLEALARYADVHVSDQRTPAPANSSPPGRRHHRHVCTHACRLNASTRPDWWRAVCAEALDTYNAELPDNPTPTDRARAAQARDTFLDTLDVARLTPAGDVDHPQQPELRSER